MLPAACWAVRRNSCPAWPTTPTGGSVTLQLRKALLGLLRRAYISVSVREASKRDQPFIDSIVRHRPG